MEVGEYGMTEEGPKNVKINLFRILKLAKVLQHSENLFKRKDQSPMEYNLPYSHLPLLSSAVTLKTGSYESQQQSAHWRGKGVAGPQNPVCRGQHDFTC